MPAPPASPGAEVNGPAGRAALRLREGGPSLLRPLRAGLPPGRARIAADADDEDDRPLVLEWPAGSLRGRDLAVAIAKRSIRVQVHGHRPAYAQRWLHNDMEIVVGEASWELADAVLTVTLPLVSNTGGAVQEAAALLSSSRLSFDGGGGPADGPE